MGRNLTFVRFELLGCWLGILPFIQFPLKEGLFDGHFCIFTFGLHFNHLWNEFLCILGKQTNRPLAMLSKEHMFHMMIMISRYDGQIRMGVLLLSNSMMM